MPVNHKQKLIFIHIPKAAGTTVERYIKETTKDDWDLWGRIHRDKHMELYPGKHIEGINPDSMNNQQKQTLYHHLILSEIRMLVDSLVYESYLKFCVIRNPWDRLVSFYEYHKQTGGRKQTQGLSFKEWFYIRPITPRILPYITVDGAVPEEVKCLRFEQFEDEFYSFMQSVSRINIRPNKSIHEKKSERRDYRDYYTKEMREMLHNECREDIDYFGYEF